MEMKVTLVRGQYGDLLVYINDYRVIGPSHSGLGHIISNAIVNTDDLPKSYTPEESE